MTDKPFTKEEVWTLVEDYYDTVKAVPSMSYLESVSHVGHNRMMEMFRWFQKQGWIRRSVNGKEWILLK